MKIAIIGAGASGLFAGSLLCEKHEITMFDKNEKCGKKLYITGKGRCNITNNCDKETFFNNVVNGKKFMFSCINQFSPKDVINFFEERGLKTKIERGERVFPQSDKSSDVIKTLQNACKKCDIKLNEEVLNISFDNSKNMFLVKTKLKNYVFDKVIIATGGKTYSATGSTGDGYKFAKMFGHKIVEIKPGLVPIEVNDKFIKQLQGVSLKNVILTAKTENKTYNNFGEMMFTDKGITGPIVLTLSSYINKSKLKFLFIDFKPSLSKQQLFDRLERDIETNKNKTMSAFVKLYLPKSVGDVFLQRLNIPFELKAKSLSKTQKNNFVNMLKEFNLSYKNLYPLDAGIITSGGVDEKEINPRTMESKLQKDLYFIGEVLNVDCLTGGFNLTTAFSTAYACANNI